MPVKDGRAGVIVAGEFDAGAEECRAAFAVEATADLFGHALEARGRNRRQVALGQFGLEPAQLFREGFEPLFFRGEGAVHEILPFDGAEVLDGMLVGAAPEDESAFGDAELAGDAGEADAFGAQLDELLNRFLSFHLNLSGSLLTAITFGRPPFEIEKTKSDGLCQTSTLSMEPSPRT
jgi:hypothetical protein